MACKYLFSRVWWVPVRKLLEVTSACKKWAEKLRDACQETEFSRWLTIRRKRRLNFGHLMECLAWIWERTTTTVIASWPKPLDIQPDNCLAHCEELGKRNGWRVQITAWLAHHLLGVAGSRCSGYFLTLPGGNKPERKGGFFPLKYLPVFFSSPLHCKPGTSLRATYSFYSSPGCALFSIFLPWSHSLKEASPVCLQKGPGHPKWLTSSQLNYSKGPCLWVTLLKMFPFKSSLQIWLTSSKWAAITHCLLMR